MHFVAFLTFLQRMVSKKLVHVGFLVRRENACSLADRTNVIEGGQNGISYKFGAIWNPFHGLQQCPISLECYDFLFRLRHIVASTSDELECICFICPELIRCNKIIITSYYDLSMEKSLTFYKDSIFGGLFSGGWHGYGTRKLFVALRRQSESDENISALYYFFIFMSSMQLLS